MRSFFPDSQEGFTIQELMVVIIVGSLIVAYCFSLFLFSSKVVQSWQKKSTARDAVFSTLQTITADIRRSRAIVGVSDSSLSLAGASNRSLTYMSTKGEVSRNGASISSRNVLISLHFEPLYQLGRSPGAVRIKVSCTLGTVAASEEATAMVPHNAKDDFLSTFILEP